MYFTIIGDHLYLDLSNSTIATPQPLISSLTLLSVSQEGENPKPIKRYFKPYLRRDEKHTSYSLKIPHKARLPLDFQILKRRRGGREAYPTWDESFFFVIRVWKTPPPPSLVQIRRPYLSLLCVGCSYLLSVLQYILSCKLVVQKTCLPRVGKHMIRFSPLPSHWVANSRLQRGSRSI